MVKVAAIGVSTLDNAEHKVENVHQPAEKHDYGYSKRAPMYNFFAQHLKLKTGSVEWNPSVNEDFVTILPAEELRVYSDDKPISDEALKGDDAIIDYLNLN